MQKQIKKTLGAAEAELYAETALELRATFTAARDAVRRYRATGARITRAKPVQNGGTQ